MVRMMGVWICDGGRVEVLCFVRNDLSTADDLAVSALNILSLADVAV